MDIARLQEEAQFADEEYSQRPGDMVINTGMFQKYEHPRQMWDWRQRAARLLGDVRGKDLLDYGSGMGEESVYFARLGARVKAIDISAKGVDLTRQRAAVNGLAHYVDARVMDAQHTDFADNSFDLAHGLGILHHVTLEAGLTEIHRVLKPGGVGVFLEPLGNSRFVESLKASLQRKLRGKFGLIPTTDGEENLRLGDLRRECARFSAYEIYPYRLTYRARKILLPRALWDWSLRLDHLLLTALPPLKHFAGAAVIRVVK